MAFRHLTDPFLIFTGPKVRNLASGYAVSKYCWVYSTSIISLALVAAAIRCPEYESVSTIVDWVDALLVDNEIQLRYVTCVAHCTDTVHTAHAHAALPASTEVVVPEVGVWCACAVHNGRLGNIYCPCPIPSARWPPVSVSVPCMLLVLFVNALSLLYWLAVNTMQFCVVNQLLYEYVEVTIRASLSTWSMPCMTKRGGERWRRGGGKLSTYNCNIRFIAEQRGNTQYRVCFYFAPWNADAV